MRAEFVVVTQPFIGQGLHLLNVFKDVGIQDFRAEGAVEAFHEGILVGLSWLDIKQLDAFGLSPFIKCMRSHLRSIVHADELRRAVVIGQAAQNTNQPSRRNRETRFDGQRFAVGFINDIERAEPPAAVERITHEVQRPATVDLGRQGKRLTLSFPHPFLATARQVQAHIAVHAVNPLVIPEATIEPNPVKAFPETPATMAGDQIIERINDRRISLGS